MKIKSSGPFITLFFVLSIVAFPFTAHAVVNWSKTPGNPLLARGGSGSFDKGGLYRPVVIKDGDTYKMWYTGIDDAGVHSIGYATSSNGTSWTKVGQVFTKGTPGSWDDSHVGGAWIIKETSGEKPYKMWYSGTNDTDVETNGQIGYAESADGINWTRYPSNPLNLIGNILNDWDGESVLFPCVIEDGSTYKMWYRGWNSTWPGGSQGTGYAESTDGITWTKHNDTNTTSDPFANSDPVIKLGNPGAWDGWSLGSYSVIKDGSVYRMWYDGTQADDTPTRIGYAYSFNGQNWKKYDGNPVIMEGTAGSFDENGLFYPMVLKDGNTYRMYYAGSRDCSTDCIDEIGYAESYAYSGPNPVFNYGYVFTLNRSTGKVIAVGLFYEGPGVLDLNGLYVLGPNGYVRGFTDSDITNWVGRQDISGGSAVAEADFTAYAGTYTFNITANNGATASKTISFPSPTVLPYPEDGIAGFQRLIELGGTSYTTDNSYISGTTPTLKWSPMIGHENKYYRVRVWDLKSSNCWFASTPTLGTQVDGLGYMSATVPSGVLFSNTPYKYEIEVLDTNNTQSAHNRSRSTAWNFYTGTKGTDFLFNPFILHIKSFMSGDQSYFGVYVNNLAPWDISVASPFQVTDGNYTYNYNFSSPNYPDLFYYQVWPMDYSNNSAPYIGAPTAGTYQFSISDGTNSDTTSRTFIDVPEVPKMTKETMSPEDNSYLQTPTPTLSWHSFAGTGYKYRVRVNTWNNFLCWASSWITGTSSAGPMSVTVPANTLQPGPYRWYVEVQDIGNNTRTRSQYLTLNLYGSTVTLNPPTLSTPADNEAGQANNVSITWLDTNTNPQESGYTVRIKPSGGSYTEYSKTQNATSHATSGLSPGATYYWSVKAVGNGTSMLDSAYPTDRTFTVTQAGFNAALYFPHIATSIPWRTEIAIINTSPDQSITGTLRALSNEGQLVETKAVTLSARGRRQITVANEFTNHANIGYIIFDTTSAAVQGYTKFYQEGVYRAAIPAVKEVNTSDIYISHIASTADWWTGVSLVNTTSARKDLTITFNNGQTVPYSLNANEHKAFLIESLLNNQPQPDIQSAVITNASGVIGLVLFGSTGGSGNQLDGVLLTDDTASTIYYPHVASNNTWWTGIVAYNPSESACTITVTPYNAAGTPLSTTNLSLAGKGKYIGLVEQLSLPAQTEWFKIDSTSPLTGFELFATYDGYQLAAYAGSGTKTGVFAKVEKSGWTGIAFVNMEAGAASVTLTAYNDNGSAVATQVLSVGGYAKVVDQAENIFSQDI
ncbi:MAG: hypothetical protein EHM85_16855, partial [Desulfobacteraceae bacterium]